MEMFGLGPTELVLILLAVVLLFGAKKIPELAKGVGKAMREFRKASQEIEDVTSVSVSPDEDKRKKDNHKESV